MGKRGTLHLRNIIDQKDLEDPFPVYRVLYGARLDLRKANASTSGKEVWREYKEGTEKR